MGYRYDNQAMLLYNMDGNGAWVLEESGQLVEKLVAERGRDVFALPGWDWTAEWAQYRKTFTVWEGAITEQRDFEVAYDSYVWAGTLRPATADDFRRFGVAYISPDKLTAIEHAVVKPEAASAKTDRDQIVSEARLLRELERREAEVRDRIHQVWVAKLNSIVAGLCFNFSRIIGSVTMRFEADGGVIRACLESPEYCNRKIQLDFYLTLSYIPSRKGSVLIEPRDSGWEIHLHDSTKREIKTVAFPSDMLNEVRKFLLRHIILDESTT